MTAATVFWKDTIYAPKEVYILVGTGAPTGGLQSAQGTLSALPGASSLYLQLDASSGNHLWTYDNSAGWTVAGSGGGGGAVSSVFGRTGSVVAANNDYTFAQLASLPTTIAGYGITDTLTNTVFGRSGTVTAQSGDYTVAQITGALSATTAASTYAPLASPALTGVPTAPTATNGTNTTQLATCAFVLANAGSGSVSSVFTRTGAVVATSGDYTVSQVTGAAPLASPTFTGTPAGPTASVGTNTTQLATTAFVLANPTINAQYPASLTGNVTLGSGDGGFKQYVTGSADRTITLPANGSAPTSNTPMFIVTIKNDISSTHNLIINNSSAVAQTTLTPNTYSTFIDIGVWTIL